MYRIIRGFLENLSVVAAPEPVMDEVRQLACISLILIPRGPRIEDLEESNLQPKDLIHYCFYYQ